MIRNKIIGSFFLLLIFFVSSFNKITNTVSLSSGLHSKLPFLSQILCNLAIYGVIILEIIAPMMILYTIVYNKNKKQSYYLTIMLIIFTILATILYHSPLQPNQYYYFMKNVSIIGGLFLLLSLLE